MWVRGKGKKYAHSTETKQHAEPRKKTRVSSLSSRHGGTVRPPKKGEQPMKGCDWGVWIRSVDD